MRKRHKSPAVSIRFSIDPLICSGGWFAHREVLCSFTSHNGKTYELRADLKSTTAIELTDYLLHPLRKTNDFHDSPSERSRLSRNIAWQLEALTWGRRREWFKRRGYPTKFKSYQKPAKSAC